MIPPTFTEETKRAVLALSEQIRVELAEHAAQQFLDGVGKGRAETLKEVRELTSNYKPTGPNRDAHNFYDGWNAAMDMIRTRLTQ